MVTGMVTGCTQYFFSYVLSVCVVFGLCSYEVLCCMNGSAKYRQTIISNEKERQYSQD
jgi:hypothetical protein